MVLLILIRQDMQEIGRALMVFVLVWKSMISWFSKHMRWLHSLAERKYIAMVVACCEAIWPHKLISKLTTHQSAYVVHCANESCIGLSENPIFPYHSKHIDI